MVPSFVIGVQQVNNINQFEGRSITATQNGPRNVTIDVVTQLDKNTSQTASISLPHNLFLKLPNFNDDTNSTTDSSRIVSLAFPRRSPLFIRRDEGYSEVGSIILSASVAGEGRIENLTDPTVDLEFEITNMVSVCIYSGTSL